MGLCKPLNIHPIKRRESLLIKFPNACIVWNSVMYLVNVEGQGKASLA